jgi:hypothetical protein
MLLNLIFDNYRKTLIWIHIIKDIKMIFFHFMNFYNVFENKNKFANHLQLKSRSLILSLTSIKISILCFYIILH